MSNAVYRFWKAALRKGFHYSVTSEMAVGDLALRRKARAQHEALTFQIRSGENRLDPSQSTAAQSALSTMRRLALHASALSDVEYDVFTESLRDIADVDQSPSSGATDDAYFERITLGIREARAWLRGRYSHVPVSSIDTASRFIHSCSFHAQMPVL